MVARPETAPATWPPTCGDCGDSMRLGHSRRSRSGRAWLCGRRGCRGFVSADHLGQPLGTPADGLTRKARAQAHQAFDRIWRSGRMTRAAAYAGLALHLSKTRDDCHIGRFTIAECTRTVAWALGLE